MNGAAPTPTPLAQIGQFRPLAHHPDCARHDHHLVRPLGVPLCLGCVGMWTGIVGGVVAAFVTWPLLTAPVAFGLSLLCYAPTFGQPFVQRRWYKLPSRVLLGLGFALGAVSLLAAPLDLRGWVFRVVAAGITWALYQAASKLRGKYASDPCVECPWGSFPLCAHNLPQLRHMRDQASDPGQQAFFTSLVHDLEPLASIAPNFEVFPEVSVRQVGFLHEDGSSLEQP
jgi:hypothetical protein